MQFDPGLFLCKKNISLDWKKKPGKDLLFNYGPANCLFTITWCHTAWLKTHISHFSEFCDNPTPCASLWLQWTGFEESRRAKERRTNDNQKFSAGSPLPSFKLKEFEMLASCDHLHSLAWFFPEEVGQQRKSEQLASSNFPQTVHCPSLPPKVPVSCFLARGI